MALRVNNNIAAINSHRNLLRNDSSLSHSLEKLSSGHKINRASEGPAALVISEHLRSKVAGVKQAIANSESGISLVQTMEANMSEANTLLVSMRQLAIHAANEGATDIYQLQVDQQEFSNAANNMTRIADSASFGSKKLLDGTQGISGTTSKDDLLFLSATAETMDSRNTGVEVSITQNATQSSIAGNISLTEEVIEGGEKLEIIQNGKQAHYTTISGDTPDAIAKKLQMEAEDNGLFIQISVDDFDMLEIISDQYGSGSGFQVKSSTEGVLSAHAGELTVVHDGNDIKGLINGEATKGQGQVLVALKGTNVEGLNVQYTGQADTEDVGAEGVQIGKVYVSQNSMMLHVGKNANQTVSLAVNSVSAYDLGRNIKNESGFRSLADVDLTSVQGANDGLMLIESAMEKIAAQRGKIGAFQKNNLESNLSNLRQENENLSDAESSIRDTDMAHEMAGYTKGQIMSQSATAMLAQANQNPKNVLKLLA